MLKNIYKVKAHTILFNQSLLNLKTASGNLTLTSALSTLCFSPQDTKMTQKLTTIGHRMAFNNEQSPYRIVSYKRPRNDNEKKQFKREN